MKFLKLLADAAIRTDERLTSIEKNMEVIVSKVSDLLGAFGEPSGFMTVGGITTGKPKELMSNLHSSAVMELEEATIEVQFSHAIYMTMVTDKEKLKKVLDEAQITFFKDLLEQHKRLDKLLYEGEERSRNAEDMMLKAKESAKFNISNMIQERCSKITKELKNKADNLQVKDRVVTDALEKLNGALSDIKKAQAQMDNIIKGQQPLKSKIYTPPRIK